MALALSASLLLGELPVLPTVMQVQAEAGDSELQLITEIPTVTDGHITNWANGENYDENYENLVDGDTSTKYGISNADPYVEFHYTEAFVPKAYILWTANDSEGTRNPKSWTIDAKLEEGDAWTTIATVDNSSGNQLPMTNNTSTEFSLAGNTTAYRYFRFNATMDASQGFQLAELQFKSTPKDPTKFENATVTGVISSYYYTGSAISISPTVTASDGTALTLGTHYTATLGSNNVTSFPFTVTAAGDYILTVTGTGEYSGSKSVSFTVTEGLSIDDSEFGFITTIPTVDGGQSTNWNTTNENYGKLVDGNTGTKYGLSNEDPWVEFHYDSGINPKGYALWTADDSNGARNPRTWTIKAKLNPRDAWTTLVTVDNTGGNKLPMADNTRTIFELNNSSAYRYFRFEATIMDADQGFQLAELQFFTGSTPTDLRRASVSGLKSNYQYNYGNAIAINYTVKAADGTELEKGTDYLADVKDSNGDTITTVRAEGTYTLTITGTGEYHGSLRRSFLVAAGLDLGTRAISNPVAPNTTGDTDGWTGSYVYYGKYDGTNPTKYRVLDTASTDFGVEGGSLLLDCDSTLYVLVFNWEASNDWATSEVKGNINGDGFLSKSGNFTDAEKAAIAVSYKNGKAAADGDGWSTLGYAGLSGERIFLLDAGEVTRASYGYLDDGDYDNNRKKGGADLWWWLRSPWYSNHANSQYAGIVADDGYLLNNAYDSSSGVSPAFNVNLSSVIFSSLITGTPGEPGAEYKLTLLDSGMSIAVTEDKSVVRSENTITVPYTISGDNADHATQVSVLITDKARTESDAQILRYGSLVVDGNLGTSGTGTFEIGDGITGTLGEDYHVYILAEDINGEKETNYASTPLEISTVLQSIEVPEAVTRLVYNGTEQTGVAAGTGYTLTGNTATNAGDYTATATLESGYIWSDGTTAAKEIAWSIAEAATEPVFRSHSVVLGGQLGVNFYMELPEIDGYDYTGSYMEFTLNGKTTRMTYESAYVDQNTGYRRFTCYLNSLQMADEIEAVFHYNNTETEINRYSVKDYVDYITSHENQYTAKELALVKSIANYGHYSQPFFANHSNWTDGYDHETMPAAFEIDNDAISAARTALADKAIVKELGDSRLSEVQYSLSFGSETCINLYVKPEEGVAIQSITCVDSKGAEKPVTTTMSGEYSKSTINKINALALGNQFTFTVVTSAGTATVKVYPLSYAYAFLNADSYQDKTDVLQAMTALYQYYEAAYNYVKAD